MRHRLCSAREIAENTLSIPHPYPDGAAEEFIARTSATDEAGRSLNLAIESKDETALASSPITTAAIRRPAECS